MHRPWALLATAAWVIASVHAQDHWVEFPQPLTQANLWSIAYGERTLVTAGEGGTILTYRYDDNVWLPQASGTPVWLVGVGYGNGRFVVVGDRGTILTSDDGGGTWTPRSSGTSTRLNAVAYGGGRWLAIGEQGTVLVSVDAATWSSRPPLGSGFLRTLAYGRGRFLIGGAGGALYTTTDSEVFTRVPIATTSDIEGAAIAPDRFFVVGSGGLRAAAAELDAWVIAPTGVGQPTPTYRGVTVRNENEASAVGEFVAATYLSARPAWSGIFGGFSLFGTAVTQGLNEVVAVGFGGKVARSNMASVVPIVASSGRTAVYGSDVTISLLSAITPVAIQWTRAGSDIPGATSPELVLRNVTPAESTAIGLRFTTATGMATISAGGPLFTVVPGGRSEVRDRDFISALPIAPTFVTPQPEGKLIVAGTFSVAPGGSATYGLARLNADGSLDPTFRAGEGIPTSTSISGIVLRPDGRIYVRGSFSNIGGQARPGLARLLPNGAVDSAFVPEAAVGFPLNMALAADGGLYVQHGAAFSNPNATISRISPSGARDSSFAPLTAHQLIGTDSQGRVLAVDLVSTSSPELARYHANGTRDPAYTRSVVTLRGLSIRSYRDDLAVTQITDHGLYAAAVTYSFTVSFAYNFTRYLPDGGIDSRYSGIQIQSPTRSGQGFGFAYRPDGGFWAVRNVDNMTVAEAYGPDGSLESTRYATLPDLSSFNLRAIARDGSLLAIHSQDGARPETLIRIRPLSGAVGRLTNLSVRSFVLSASEPLIVGFVTTGTGSSRALLRAVGPGLAAFGVGDRMGDPEVTFTLNGATAAANNQWDAALASRFAAVGAFPLTTGSNDAALESAVGSGDYTMVVAPSGGSSGGTVLAELYDSADASPPPRRFVNISARGSSSAERPHIVGFTLTGELPRTVLIRAAGPSLAAFGVSSLLADPKLTIHRAGGAAIWENEDWATSSSANAISAAGTRVGAFGFTSGSKDAAALLTLAPGSYTAVISGRGDTSGTTLAEVYEIP